MSDTSPFNEVGPLDYDPEVAIEALEDTDYIRSIVPPGVTIEQLVATYNAVHHSGRDDAPLPESVVAGYPYTWYGCLDWLRSVKP